MIGGKRVCVVMPAYNAEKTVQRTVQEIDRAVADDLILVDDQSKDDTVKVANSVVVPVYSNQDQIPDLVAAIDAIASEVPGDSEAVYVIDGSPENCADVAGRSKARAILVWTSEQGVLPDDARRRFGIAKSVGECLDRLAVDDRSPHETGWLAWVRRMLGSKEAKA